MTRINEIKLKAGEPIENLQGKIEKKLGVPKGSLGAFHIVSESVDARRKPEIFRVFNVELGERPAFSIERKQLDIGFRPVVAGFGPCGMFAALRLARAGVRPIVLERGSSMEKRIQDVEAFWKNGTLNKNSNVQFGEGGAGTFSDGKLTTGTKSSYARYILESFVLAGADEDILWKQKPHIGTDVLRTAVVNIREEIKSLGGEILFDTRLEKLDIEDSKLKGVITDSGEYIKTDAVILALGHSARDSVNYLYEKGFLMEQKAFSMGVRIEHPQSMIDLAQYGAASESLGLGPADYKLNVRTSNGRGVYTFCMCPGGYVAASASEEGLLVVNGMSNRKRDGSNANSAVLCDVNPSDFGSSHPLAGLAFQEKYEKLAFELGGGNYMAPAETVGSFLKTDPAVKPIVEPTYKPGITMCSIEKCLPDFAAESLREALPMLGKKLKGFDHPGALLTAIESRSSSPVRIKRTAAFCAAAVSGDSIEGVYPGGEGAGYAGGIMSAAADGVRLAEQILSLHFGGDI